MGRKSYSSIQEEESLAEEIRNFACLYDKLFSFHRLICVFHKFLYLGIFFSPKLIFSFFA